MAKTAFRTASHAVPVRRGDALRPLYVTSAGIPAERAAALVAGMAGPYRLPDALRRVDALARWETSWPPDIGPQQRGAPCTHMPRSARP